MFRIYQALIGLNQLNCGSKLTPITDHDSDGAVHCSWYSVDAVADGGGSSAGFEPVD
jgi:uncharacterized protein YodC (DUF2158 family)